MKLLPDYGVFAPYAEVIGPFCDLSFYVPS